MITVFSKLGSQRPWCSSERGLDSGEQFQALGGVDVSESVLPAWACGVRGMKGGVMMTGDWKAKHSAWPPPKFMRGGILGLAAGIRVMWDGGKWTGRRLKTCGNPRVPAKSNLSALWESYLLSNSKSSVWPILCGMMMWSPPVQQTSSRNERWRGKAQQLLTYASVVMAFLPSRHWLMTLVVMVDCPIGLWDILTNSSRESGRKLVPPATQSNSHHNWQQLWETKLTSEGGLQEDIPVALQ